jgi:phosphoglycerate dehydrogenase-like enzyme
MSKLRNKIRIFILSPNFNSIFQKQLNKLKELKQIGRLIIVKVAKPFREVKSLFNGSEEKIIALDPDFCNWNLPNIVFDKVVNLKAVCLQTVSTQWVDLDYARQKSIIITSLPGFSSRSAAEYEVMMAMDLARKLPLVARDNWSNDFSKYRGLEMLDKTAGILGIGRVGESIGQICSALGMKVVYWSRKSRDRKFKLVSLRRLFSDSDFIFSAIPDNKETRKLLGADLLNKVKKTVILVSVFKCALNDDRRLIKKACQKEIYGYGFERQKQKRGFIYKGNVFVAPNIGWVTDGSVKRNADQWLGTIINATKGKFPTRVN